MATSILKIGISQNLICDNLVCFPKSDHIFRNQALQVLYSLYNDTVINTNIHTLTDIYIAAWYYGKKKNLEITCYMVTKDHICGNIYSIVLSLKQMPLFLIPLLLVNQNHLSVAQASSSCKWLCKS